MDDNYETKPLSENAKWPSDNRTVNIFRAESLQKYGVEEKGKKKFFLLHKKGSSGGTSTESECVRYKNVPVNHLYRPQYLHRFMDLLIQEEKQRQL